MFVYRPVLRGLMPESALYDGSVTLERLADLSELIDVQDENERRHNAWLAKRPPGG